MLNADTNGNSGRNPFPEEDTDSANSSFRSSPPPRSRPPSPPPPPGGGADHSATQEVDPIVHRLLAQNYHPVLIVGGPRSGKSTLVASMLSYLQGPNSPISVQFDRELNTYSGQASEEVAASASIFFHDVVEKFGRHGFIPGETQAAMPFFVPITLMPRNPALPEVRIAIMDYMGEVLNPITSPAGLKAVVGQKDLPAQITGVLQHFVRGASLVYALPTRFYARDDKDGNEERVRGSGKSDLSVSNAIAEYVRHRSHLKHLDHHLMCVTKWDEHAQPGVNDQWLVAPAKSDVIDYARAQFERAWNAFNNLKCSDGKKAVLQHSSGFARDNRLMAGVAPEHRAVLDHYAKTLANWLYENATECHEGIKHRTTLFPEVFPPRPVPRTRLQRTMDAVFGSR